LCFILEMMFFDSHCHLASEQLAPQFDQVLEAARAANATGFCNIGDNVSSSRAALQQAKVARQRGFVCGASVGVHPGNSREYSHETANELRVLAADENACAIGEIGLDYHYDESHLQHPGASREVQQYVLRAQLLLASELNLPVVIHNRDADEDLLRIVGEFPDVRGVFHCFSSSLKIAARVLALGFHLGFGGIATFKNAASVREAAQFCPLDKLLLETDAPYLAPVPHRGKTNEPQFLPFTAAVIAPLHNISVEELAAVTHENARRLFGL
jgi:TatD DNase family protein